MEYVYRITQSQRIPIFLGLLSLLFLPRLLSAAPDINTANHQDSQTSLSNPEPLLAAVRDTQLDLPSRTQAACVILRGNNAPAIEALRIDLATSPDTNTQLAIIQALAALSQPPDSFAPLLFEMLASAPNPIQTEVASALGRYPDDSVLRKLKTIASETDSPLSQRKAAIQALSSRHSFNVAQSLMKLISPDQHPAVRDASFAALARLTGITELGTDLPRWTQWWDEQRKLGPQTWNDRLIDNFVRGQSDLVTQLQHTLERLLEAQRQLYRAADPSKRPPLLASMLNDPIEAIRLLGIDLTVQLLAEQGSNNIPPELRKELTTRLEDPSPQLRLRAALLVRDLAEEPGADLAADLLLKGQEQRPDLLRAFFLVLTRMPRPQAISPALDLLNHPTLRSDAAAMLCAASDAGMINPDQIEQALSILRFQASDPTLPEQQTIALLGRIGRDEDWQRIHAWLNGNDPNLQQAAASAWAQSPNQPLSALLEQAHDPVVLPILLDAAARRGSDPQLFKSIAGYRPDKDPLLETWRRAIIAMAGRATAPAVADVDDDLISLNETPEIRTKLLSAAIDRLLAQVPTTQLAPSTQPTSEMNRNPDLTSLVDLILRRAHIRLLDNDPTSALADCQRILTYRLIPTPPQQRRRDVLTIRARLALSDLDGIFELTRKLLTDPHNNDAQPIIDQWVLLIRKQVDTGRIENARRALSMLHELLDGTSNLDVSITRQLAELNTLTGTTSASTPATQPATQAAGP